MCTKVAQLSYHPTCSLKIKHVYVLCKYSSELCTTKIITWILFNEYQLHTTEGPANNYKRKIYFTTFEERSTHVLYRAKPLPVFPFL